MPVTTLSANPLVRQWTAFRPKAGAPRFGSIEAVADYHDIFARQPALTAYSTNGKDTISAYKALSARAQKVVDGLTKTVSPQEMKDYFDGGKLGVLEEYADMVSEYDALIALQHGVISQDSLQRLASGIIQPALDQHQTFEKTLEQVAKALNSRQYKDFQSLCGIHDEAVAKELLSVICFKFAIFMAKGDERNATTLTQSRLIGEAEEWGTHLTDNLALGMTLVNHARTFCSDAQRPSISDFGLMPEKLLHQRLGLDAPLPQAEILQFAIAKLMGRQELDYQQHADANPKNHLGYNDRKDVLKRFESLLEASVLKRNGITPLSPEVNVDALLESLF